MPLARGCLGLIVGAVLVAGIVTPALAATEAGQHAVPHGEHVDWSSPDTTEFFGRSLSSSKGGP